jgi:hypothetical protein
MFPGERGWCPEANEQVPEDQVSDNFWGNDASCGASALRRIERLRELHQLRDLLDDPGFDDPDWTAGCGMILETANEKTTKKDK